MRRDRAQALRQAVDSWQAEHAEALAAYELGELARECQTVPRDIRALWDATMQRGQADLIDDVEQEGQRLLQVFDSILDSARRTQALVQNFEERTGREVAERAALEQAVAEGERLRASFKQQWPWDDDPLPEIDHQKINEAMEASRRGDFVYLEDLIREIQSSDPAADSK